MKRLILTALVVVGLMGVALPGTLMAAKGGNSAAAHDCRENWDDLGFENKGACVSFLAQGGTLGTFESTCIGHGGTPAASGQEPTHGETFAPICSFNGITLTAFAAAQTALEPFCPPDRTSFVWQPDADPDVIGCQ